jgi:thiazolylpeptide-type bacteriocin precursor
MTENQVATRNSIYFNDLQELELGAFEIDELVELDVNAPSEVSTSSTTSSSTSSSCG